MNDDLHVSSTPGTDDAKDGQGREREMRLLAERFRDYAEISPQWFWEYDRDFRYTYVSTRGLEFYGMSVVRTFGADCGLDQRRMGLVLG